MKIYFRKVCIDNKNIAERCTLKTYQNVTTEMNYPNEDSEPKIACSAMVLLKN